MQRSPESRRAALAALFAAAGLAGCASPGGSSTPAAVPAAAKPAAAAPASDAKLSTMLVYGNQGVVAPYQLFLGTPANFSLAVPNNGTGKLDAGAIKVEPTKVGDVAGAKFTWTGGLGQTHLQSKTASDLLDYLEANGAMVFDAVIHKAPEDQVTMRVDCRYPCLGVVDMTDFLRKAPLEQKVQVKLPLRCFEVTGTKFTAVNTPLVIFTTKPFVMSMANVRWVPGAAKDADVSLKCA